MLTIKDLRVEIEGKEIIKGLDLEMKKGEVHAIMGPNGAGKSTLSAVIAGRDEYKVTGGSIEFDGKDIMELAPENRAHLGIFLSFQYPVEIPGVSVTNFIKTAINESRKARKLEPMHAKDLLKRMKEKQKLLEMDKAFMSRAINEGFSGGEKKRNEIFQMAMLNPKLSILDETDSGLDIDALRIVANGVNKLKNKNNAVMIITHYQRLLEHIIPDFVHVLFDGKIVKTGDKNLALRLEAEGYDWIKKRARSLKQNTLKLQDKLSQSFEALGAQLNSSESDTLRQLRAKSFDIFQSQGFPTTKDEEWKYTSLNKIIKRDFEFVSEQTSALNHKDIAPFLCADIDAYQLVFVNGVFNDFLSKTVVQDHFFCGKFKQRKKKNAQIFCCALWKTSRPKAKFGFTKYGTCSGWSLYLC
jgi:Fe-S cluster assembly ATP-binding protein